MGEELGRDFWNERYRSGDTPWDSGRPAPPLARALADPAVLPPQQHIAFVGVGRGHDAIYGARLGHRVTGIDFAGCALQAADDLASQAGVAERCRWVELDLFTLAESGLGPFDALVEYTCFCAIDPSRRPEYVRNIAAVLRPGGLLVALFFPLEEREDGPPWPVSEVEVERLFMGPDGPFELVREEHPGDSVELRAGREWLVVLRRTAGTGYA